eukprot:273134-Prorocentrum_minimum.AAC.2
MFNQAHPSARLSEHSRPGTSNEPPDLPAFIPKPLPMGLHKSQFGWSSPRSNGSSQSDRLSRAAGVGTVLHGTSAGPLCPVKGSPMMRALKTKNPRRFSLRDEEEELDSNQSVTPPPVTPPPVTPELRARTSRVADGPIRDSPRREPNSMRSPFVLADDKTSRPREPPSPCPPRLPTARM